MALYFRNLNSPSLILRGPYWRLYARHAWVAIYQKWKEKDIVQG